VFAWSPDDDGDDAMATEESAAAPPSSVAVQAAAARCVLRLVTCLCTLHAVPSHSSTTSSTDVMWGDGGGVEQRGERGACDGGGHGCLHQRAGTPHDQRCSYGGDGGGGGGGFNGGLHARGRA
jgi:hypothetical protein